MSAFLWESKKLPRQKGMSMAYWISKTIFGVFFAIGFKTRIVGCEKLPKRGAFLLAANHASYFDPPLISGITPKPLHFLARKSLLKNAWLWVLHRALNIIPVDVEGHDVVAIKTAIRTLKEDKPLVIFPEGSRSRDGTLQRGKPGGGFIACKAGVPVVPVRVFGTYDALDKTTTKPKWGMPLTVVIGDLMPAGSYDPGPKDPDRYQKAIDNIMAAIAKIEKPEAHTQSEVEWAM